MRVRRAILGLYLPLLLIAGAVPLQAQFTTYGCPIPTLPSLQLDGFTAGQTSSSLTCLTGTFQPSLQYDITFTRTDTNQSTTLTTFNGGNTMSVTVPATFYATFPAGQTTPVPVNVSIDVPSLPGNNQNGTFQINPPLAAGGPVFLSGVNSAVTWTMYTGGTPPYQNQSGQGSTPTGMNAFPPASPDWTGTPNQTGVFGFTMTVTDGWGNQLTPNLAVDVLPIPQITGVNPASAAVGSGTFALTVNGSGFVAPATVGPTNEPGSTLQVVYAAGSPVVLTPTAISATQMTVNLPSTSMTAEGFLQLTVSNLGITNSIAQAFELYPTVTALSTSIRTAGAPAFRLGVTGTGFAAGAVVQMNGTPLSTTFVNSTSLTAAFPSVSTPGAIAITVVNPDTTATPIPQDLTIVPAPVITALRPASVNAGGAAFALTVTGSGFLNGATVYFNSIAVPTTLVPNQLNNMLVANVPAPAIATAGIVPVYVETSDGYITPSLLFTIISTGPPPLQLLTFSPLPPGVVNTVYSDTFAATAGAGGYTFSVIGGNLPAGLQLSSAGLLSGTPTAVGSSQFIAQVTDSAGNSVARNFTMAIAPQPLSFTSGPLASTVVNTPLSVQFAGSGGVPPYTFVEFGALPPGVTLSSAGLLSGTPTKAGSYPFLLFIDDTANASVSKSFTLNVALPGLLITTASPLPAGQVNQPYTTPLAATGGVGAPFTWSATGLPPGLTIASNTGLIAGIPRATGTFTVGVTLGDSSGTTVTQNYTLVIAGSAVTITNASLSNSAVGSFYSAAVTASGGSGSYTFTATGLPPGLTLTPSGSLSGTPTTAGAFTVAVTATDSSGLTGSASFKVTIAAKLVVTPVTIPNAVVGTAISAVTLTATGGTPPYQWQSATVPPGLSLALNGTLSGTPAAAGTFSFAVFAVDSSGALASGTEQVTVALPTVPAASITGLPPSTAPATQPFLQISLANPYPATITANLTLTFAPASGADDPSIQFATGGRTAQVVIPAGNTSSLTNVGVQTGTVAGTITITAQLLAGSVNVTPTPAPSQKIVVTAGAPVITKVTAVRTSTGFTVTVTGFASNRDVDSGTYQFLASGGATLATAQVSTTVTSLFTQWYGSSISVPFGSQFTLSQPFSVNGSTSSVLSVSVTLTNALGTSPAASANLQ